MSQPSTESQPAPDALLLLTPQCPHCPAVLQALSQMVKEGRVGRLEVVNIAVQPEPAETLGVRSVPWIRIGEFELEGSHTPAELRRWAERAQQPEGVAGYLEELLEGGQLSTAEAALKRHPHWMETVIAMLGREDSGISVRLGIGAMLESLAGSDLLREYLEPMAELLKSGNHSVRADAVHYLGLSQSPEVLPYLQQALDDPEPEVREIASESLADLAGLGIHPSP